MQAADGGRTPLVPAEVDLTDFPFMPVLIARLKQSRAWLLCKRRPELAFYMLNLWTASWHARPAASLEDDDDVLADLAMCQPTAWKRVRTDVLRGWVGCSDGRLYHPVVAEQALSAWERKSAQRARTEAARLARVGKRKSQSDAAATTQPVVATTETVTDHATDHATDLVTTPVTGSVTEPVTDNVTASKGQGEGQGQLYTLLTEGGLSPHPDPLTFRSVLGGPPGDAATPPDTDPPGPDPDPVSPGTHPPDPAVQPDLSAPERELFARGRAVLGRNAGGQVTKLLRRKGGNVALARAAIETASTKDEPREYVARIIRGDDTGMPPGQLYDRSI